MNANNQLHIWRNDASRKQSFAAWCAEWCKEWDAPESVLSGTLEAQAEWLEAQSAAVCVVCYSGGVEPHNFCGLTVCDDVDESHVQERAIIASR